MWAEELRAATTRRRASTSVLLYGSEAACLSPNKDGDTAHLRSFAAGGQIHRLPTLCLQGALGDQQQGCAAGAAAENPKRCLQEHTQQHTDLQSGSPSTVVLRLLICLGTRAMPSTFLKLKSCSASCIKELHAMENSFFPLFNPLALLTLSNKCPHSLFTINLLFF